METFKYMVVILLAVITKGFALNCYECMSDTTAGCTKGSPLLKETNCGLQNNNLLQFCLIKQVYDKKFENTSIQASCEYFMKPIGREGKHIIPAPEAIIVLDRNVQQCQPSSKDYDVKTCDVCKTDLCNFINTAHTINTTSYLLMLLPLFYYLLRFI